MSKTCLLGLLATFILGPPSSGALAAIQDASDNGFTSVNVAQVMASPAETYAAVAEIGQWWHPDHTYWGDAENLYMQPEVGGIFGEHKPDRSGGVQHAEVLWLDPDQGLRLRGAFGPLQKQALVAVLTLTFAAVPADGGDSEQTEIAFKYAVGGYVAGGLSAWAPIVDGVMGQQLARLKAYLEIDRN